jgi:CRISPR/Cas system-associated endonuclease Cas3-HD
LIRETLMVKAILSKMIAYNGDDVRRINHAIKVFSFASLIAREEGLAGNGLLVVEVAAILHDIGIHKAEEKYHSSAGEYQEREGPAVARELLAGLGLDPELQERALYIIGHHHSYGKIDGLDFQAVVEADFLVNAYEDNLAREAIESVRKKIFKTNSGTRLLDSMYLG